MLPPLNQMIIWLQQAVEKAPEVQVLRRRFKEQRRIDLAKAQLEFALATGLLSECDLGRMLAAAAAGEDLVSLTAGIELFDGVPMDRLQPSNVEELLDVPVQMARISLKACGSGMKAAERCRGGRCGSTDRLWAPATSPATRELRSGVVRRHSSGLLPALAFRLP